MTRAKHAKGNTGQNLICLLESRLDNIVYRLGFARTTRAARQMVNHGHINVNGNRVDIPSYQLRAGDVVQLRENSKHKERGAAEMAGPVTVPMPSYLERDEPNLAGIFRAKPEHEDCPLAINEALVVELYALAL